jgi:hypothetical protein
VQVCRAASTPNATDGAPACQPAAWQLRLDAEFDGAAVAITTLPHITSLAAFFTCTTSPPAQSAFRCQVVRKASGGLWMVVRPGVSHRALPPPLSAAPPGGRVDGISVALVLNLTAGAAGHTQLQLRPANFCVAAGWSLVPLPALRGGAPGAEDWLCVVADTASASDACGQPATNDSRLLVSAGDALARRQVMLGDVPAVLVAFAAGWQPGDSGDARPTQPPVAEDGLAPSGLAVTWSPLISATGDVPQPVRAVVSVDTQQRIAAALRRACAAGHCAAGLVVVRRAGGDFPFVDAAVRMTAGERSCRDTCIPIAPLSSPPPPVGAQVFPAPW